MRRSGQLLGFEERGLGLGQAHVTLESDSASEEATITRIVVAINLCIKHAAPKQDGRGLGDGRLGGGRHDMSMGGDWSRRGAYRSPLGV